MCGFKLRQVTHFDAVAVVKRYEFPKRVVGEFRIVDFDGQRIGIAPFDALYALDAFQPGKERALVTGGEVRGTLERHGDGHVQSNVPVLPRGARSIAASLMRRSTTGR
jgi:hypothetical protein